jgi:hypothetical protein
MSCIKYANCRNVGIVLLNFHVSFYTVFGHIVMSILRARLDLKVMNVGVLLSVYGERLNVKYIMYRKKSAILFGRTFRMLNYMNITKIISV